MTPLRLSAHTRGLIGNASLLFLCFLAAASTAASQTAVTTYHNDNSRTGQNVQETILNTSNVNSTSFGKITQMFYAADGVGPRIIQGGLYYRF